MPKSTLNPVKGNNIIKVEYGLKNINDILNILKHRIKLPVIHPITDLLTLHYHYQMLTVKEIRKKLCLEKDIG